MDREPFSTYRPYAHGLMADGFVDGKLYAYLSVAAAKRQTQVINAAFEVRVKEEVKKAVEDFRDKVVFVIEKERLLHSSLSESCEMDPHEENEMWAESHLADQCEELRDLVRELPTEPEGK